MNKLIELSKKVFAPKRSFQVPVYHMASMARSGETMMLSLLDRHPQLQVVHNLRKQDEQYELDLFEYLRTCDEQVLASGHPLVAPYQLRTGQKLVLKQGVWEHRSEFKGIVLARNPISIFASLLTYDGPANERGEFDWSKNEKRLTTWMEDIDPGLNEQLSGKNPVEQFALFYNRRMGSLIQLGLPVFRYEDVVKCPQQQLPKILSQFDVEWEPAMLESSEAAYVGHGKNLLGSPVSEQSLTKYAGVIDEATFDQLKSLTSSTASEFGYKLGWQSDCV